MDEITMSKAITEGYIKDFIEVMEVDIAIAGAGPGAYRRLLLGERRDKNSSI